MLMRIFAKFQEASEAQDANWSPAGLKQFRHKIYCDFQNVSSFDSECKQLDKS